MQPSEPGPGPATQPPSPVAGPVPSAGPPPVAPPGPPPGPSPGVPPVPPPAKRPNRRLRLILALGAGILTLLCLGGVGVFISLYDEATEIKRAAPDAVVDSYLRAYLVNRDDDEAALFACRSGADVSSIAALRSEALKREQDFDVKVVVTWSSLAVSGSGDERRTVTANLTIAGVANGNTQSRRTESWSFDVVENGGWRVCGASRVA